MSTFTHSLIFLWIWLKSRLHISLCSPQGAPFENKYWNTTAVLFPLPSTEAEQSSLFTGTKFLFILLSEAPVTAKGRKKKELETESSPVIDSSNFFPLNRLTLRQIYLNESNVYVIQNTAYTILWIKASERGEKKHLKGVFMRHNLRRRYMYVHRDLAPESMSYELTVWVKHGTRAKHPD